MKKLMKTVLAMLLLGCMALSMVACGDDTTAADLAALKDGMASVSANLDAVSKELAAVKAELGEVADAVIPEVEVVPEGQLASNYGEEIYESVLWLEANAKERDCIAGADFVTAKKYILAELKAAGYTEGEGGDIEIQDVTFERTMTKEAYAEAKSARVCTITTDGKYYKNTGSGWRPNLVESTQDDYTHVKATIVSPNIIVTKKGEVDDTIIVGAHYDGNGASDNGSGVALALVTAKHLFEADNHYTIKTVFFTAEEIGLIGATYYAENMTEEEVADTLYYLNLDSIMAGDYTYLYGGVQDNATKTVKQTEAYDNAMAIAEELGLEFKSNPWTWDNLSPDDEGQEFPSYASPSTGDWSDHADFAAKGITYLYFEATNWEIPDYTGYGETEVGGMFMNTPKDYIENIESFFPGRALSHLTKFSTLMNALVMQDDYVVPAAE